MDTVMGAVLAAPARLFGQTLHRAPLTPPQPDLRRRYPGQNNQPRTTLRMPARGTDKRRTVSWIGKPSSK